MDQRVTYVGIDLGGARGKTTAVARLTADIDAATNRPSGPVRVQEVCTRFGDNRPWCDNALTDYLGQLDGAVIVAINAPLTVPACLRCQLSACPGEAACVDPAVVWLKTTGASMVEAAVASDRDRIAAIPTHSSFVSHSVVHAPEKRSRLLPYVHRCSEVVLHYKQGVIPRDLMGNATGPIAARASQLRRRLVPMGYRLNDNLLEVSPRATVHSLFGADKARGYKRDGDPWETRAAIVESLDMVFALTSRLSREEVLRNDHCFESLLSAYTAYLKQRDDWRAPGEGDDELWGTDGLVWFSE